MRFCFNHTIVQKLHQEDEENGTGYLTLFWLYLCCGRNATLVAQRMHLHRNTVLYHVEKIQRRFDFDLSWRATHDRMLLDLRAFFLAENCGPLDLASENAEPLPDESEEGYPLRLPHVR